jgi:hypothetical protein
MTRGDAVQVFGTGVEVLQTGEGLGMALRGAADQPGEADFPLLVTSICCTLTV